MKQPMMWQKGGIVIKDSEIVDLYWKREEQAVQETSKKYEAYLSKIAYGILSDFEDSRECVNDTYLAAWNSMPEHRPSVLSTYLGKIIRQIAIDRFRANHSQKRYASEYALALSELENALTSQSTPETEFAVKQLDEAINTFVRSLKETERTVFLGRYYFFDSIKTISAYCGLREANTKTILYRIRQRLRAYLVMEGFDL